MSETIFALSSGALPSGVAIIRLSGCNAQAGSTKNVRVYASGGEIASG